MGALILYAPNVGSGGGLVLLRELLKADWGDWALRAIMDRRGRAVVGDDAKGFEVDWVKSSVAGRWRAERLLSSCAAPGDIVLCFHSLPPVFSNRGHVVCFVQNANLVGLIPKSHLKGWLRVRYAVERLIARGFRSRVRRYFVQTPTMAEALARWYGPDAPPIQVTPFMRPTVDDARSPDAERRWDFLYVSDGSFHKNHGRLFDAWRQLAEQGLRPSLAVTLHPDRDAALCAELRDLVATHCADIENLGHLPHAEVLQAYARARALIFPSYMESFGIPLLEAQAADLPILAPELDYVRDVCSPATTFDPFSPRSIARAVQRFLGSPSDQLTPLNSQAFVDLLRTHVPEAPTRSGISC